MGTSGVGDNHPINPGFSVSDQQDGTTDETSKKVEAQFSAQDEFFKLMGPLKSKAFFP